jgi:EamA domain-containing membrane protein RarD
MVCPYCHQPVLSSYYFCPNCGTKLTLAPLSTTPETQAWIYAFSAILPMILFIMVSKWPGIKYYKSEDKKTKQIGTIAIIILTASTIIMLWLGYVWTMEAIQSSVNSINADMSA